MKKIFVLLLSICMVSCLLFTACGKDADLPVPTAAPAETPVPTPEPTPTPTPFVEPSTAPSSNSLIFDAKELPSGLLLIDGEEYIKLSEAVAAMGSELVQEDDGMTFTFDWRLGHVTLRAESSAVNYMDEDREMALPALHCSNQTDLYVPVYSFCDAVEVGTLYDDEFSTLYCTPAAGDWKVPEGYDVPVFMYHCIDWPPSPDANLMVHPETFEQQLKYLTENGYTTIWFEDLWNIENIEKPVILTFDDGYTDNYKYMFPILEKYGCKATISVITSSLLPEPHLHMSADMAKELSQSGLVSIQSHTVSHDPPLDYRTRENQDYEMTQSRLDITRLTGKQPMVMCYPSGGANDDTLDLASQYYKFGLKMHYVYGGLDNTYNTSDNPFLVYRFFVEQLTPLEDFAQWAEHRTEGALNG